MADNEKKTYRQWRIGSTEQIKNTLQRLVNAVGNHTMDEKTVRLMTEIIKVRISLQKNVELENEIQEIKDIVYNNVNSYEEYEEYDEDEE